MVPYIVLFVCLLFGGFFEVCRPTNMNDLEETKEKYKNFYAIIPGLIIFFLGVFRETSVGADAQSYYIYYWNRLEGFTWNELFTNFSIDNGFFIILKVIALFTGDWWLARATLFVLTFSLYYVIIIKESDYPCVSLLIFVGLANICFMLGILRQSLAIGICFFAYKYLKKNEWLKFIIFVLIAATIHKTALISLYAFIVSFFKLKKISHYKFILLSSIAAVVFYVAIPMITASYNTQIYENVATSDGGYGMLLFMMIVFAILGYLMNHIKRNEESTELNTELVDKDEAVSLFNISCGAFFVQIGALQWSLLNRATACFSIYWCLLFPKLLNKLSQKNRLQVYLLLVVLFGFMFFYQIDEVEFFVMHSF
ncbi:MAG: EpsG family protein [Ruminococcaceae bacterium]|nr:EpsG family protein [Oscillospiraceae bacterium]